MYANRKYLQGETQYILKYCFSKDIIWDEMLTFFTVQKKCKMDNVHIFSQVDLVQRKACLVSTCHFFETLEEDHQWGETPASHRSVSDRWRWPLLFLYACTWSTSHTEEIHRNPDTHRKLKNCLEAACTTREMLIVGPLLLRRITRNSSVPRN